MPRAPSRRKSPSPAAAPTPPPVAFRDGVQLGGTVVWCDAGRARDLVLLSHAHHASRGAHGKVLMTERTRALLAASGGAPAGEVLVTPFGRPFGLGGLRLELYPSGHVPGAASLLLTEPSGRRIAYAGDVNPTRALGEPAEVRGADVLVVEAPLASTAGRLPPRAEVLEKLVSLVDEARRAGRAPVVLAPALGVAQEALAALATAGIPLRAHPRIAALAAAYPSLGIPLPPAARFAGRLKPGEALLLPLDRRAPAALGQFREINSIALTGAALEPGAAARLGVDHALPLCDHADQAALLEYVAHTGAAEVYFTAGFGEAVRAALAARKVRAFPLGPPRQMELFAQAG